eukprot:7382004-Prymnesium_polylepis.3
MVGVNRQHVEHAALPRRSQRVARVVGRRPRVGPISERAVGELVEDTLVRVQVGAQEGGVLEHVRQPIVLVRVFVGVCLRCDRH